MAWMGWDGMADRLLFVDIIYIHIHTIHTYDVHTLSLPPSLPLSLHLFLSLYMSPCSSFLSPGNMRMAIGCVKGRGGLRPSIRWPA